MPLPIITEAADLLALLDEAPHRRAITYGSHAEARPSVYEYPAAHVDGPGRALAIVGLGSADGLLHAAIDADVRHDLAAYAASPLRFCPGLADAAWLHPDHPAAPTAPCINRDRHRGPAGPR